MSIAARKMMRCERAASAAEFALVAPLLITFLLGTIDVGRFMWELNLAEKATQMGARYAVVSDPVDGLVNVDFVDGYSVPGGDVVPTGVFENTECDNSECTATGSASGDSEHDPDAFDAIVTWMQRFDPNVQAANVVVSYRNVGLGYSGNPTGPDVSPLTTVELRNLTFAPLILFGGTFTLPPIKASLTLEDGECSITDDCDDSN